MNWFKEPIVLYRRMIKLGIIKGIKMYILELKDLKSLGYLE